MRKNLVIPAASSAVLAWMVSYFLFINPMAACSPGDTGKPVDTFRNWITVAIKFKTGTNGEMRDMTIRSVEKLLVDSFMAHTDPPIQNYDPIITISWSPSIDTLHYDVNIGPGTNSVNVQSLPVAGKPTKKPPCNCTVNCGVCSFLNDHVSNPGSSPEYANIASITYPTPEIEPRQ